MCMNNKVNNNCLCSQFLTTIETELYLSERATVNCHTKKWSINKTQQSGLKGDMVSMCRTII